MCRKLTACLLILATPPLLPPALADTCRDEIAALYDGGALDPFVQPPHRYETTVTGPDGAVKWEMVTWFDTPLKSLSGMKGQMMTLMVGRRSWIGQSPQGPWTEAPNQNPDDMEAFHKAVRDQMAKNIRDAECPGIVEQGGETLLSYRFTTRTDPNPAQGGTYFGATHTVFITPETGRLARVEQTGHFAHYQPEPGGDRWAAIYDFTDPMMLSAPD